MFELHGQGYKAQCEPVVERVGRLIAACEARRESMLIEGVHLSINSIMRIMARHPCVVPFLIHISNEMKHQERFAVDYLITCLQLHPCDPTQSAIVTGYRNCYRLSQPKS